MDLETSTLVPGVPVESALAWWLDFREGATDHAFLGVRVRRRILARGPEGVEMDDRAPLFRERTRARREGDRVVFEGRNTVSDFDGSYQFLAAPEGTRIVLRARIRLRGVARAGAWMAPPVARWVLIRDLEGHARACAASFKAAATKMK